MLRYMLSYIYIYIYREREKERGKETERCIYICYVYAFVYIFVVSKAKFIFLWINFFTSILVITFSKMRSSSLEVFYNADAVQNYTKYSLKHLCLSLFLEEESHTGVSLCFAKYITISSLQNICERLPLKKEASRVTRQSEACQKIFFCIEELVFW